MQLCFQREVVEERGWPAVLRARCAHLAEHVAYLDGLIRELQSLGDDVLAIDSVTYPREGDDVLVVDLVTYLRAIWAFEAEKLASLQTLFVDSHTHLCQRRGFVG